jgi:hypothetical protein
MHKSGGTEHLLTLLISLRLHAICLHTHPPYQLWWQCKAPHDDTHEFFFR